MILNFSREFSEEVTGTTNYDEINIKREIERLDNIENHISEYERRFIYATICESQLF